MKKFLALLLAVLMLLSVVACTPADNGDKPNDGDEVVNPGDNTGDNDDDNDDNNEDNNDDNVEEAEKTLGQYFLEKFVELKTATPTATAEEIVMALLESNVGMAKPGLMPMPVEPGYLTAMGEEEFTGFTTGALFTPMMMGVPFIGYVFDLAEGEDVAAFAEKVRLNANPRWNICTEAEDTTIGTCGNSVFIVMCEKKAPGALTGKADIVEPTVEAGSANETAWEGFKTVMAGLKDEIVAENIATALTANGFAGEVAAITEDIGDEVFLYGIGQWDYETAASVTAENGDTAYIFVLEAGSDAAVWTSYFCEFQEGVNATYGVYNLTILVLVNA